MIKKTMMGYPSYVKLMSERLVIYHLYSKSEKHKKRNEKLALGYQINTDAFCTGNKEHKDGYNSIL